MAFFVVGGVLALGGSGFVWLRSRRTSSRGAAMAAGSVPLCVYVALALSLVLAATKTSDGQDNWDTARLVPSVALVKGQQVYSTRTAGSVQSTMYPPAWVISYLPVVAADAPAGVLRIGMFLTLLFSFAPVVLLFRNGSPDWNLTVLGSTSFLFLSTAFESLSYSLFRPHADAPSLGYAMLACVLALRPGPPTMRRFAGIALLAWLSILSKQVMVVLLVALPLWVFLVHGRRRGAHLVAWLIVTGLGLILLSVPIFGAQGVLFNTLVIPGRTPWEYGQYPRPLAVALVSAELLVHCLPLVILLTIGAFVHASSGRSVSRPGLRSFLAMNAWTLPALVAVVSVPVSIMGRVKVGGLVNTFSPTTYFLLAAGILALIGTTRPSSEDNDVRELHYRLKLLALCALLLAIGGAARMPLLAASFPLEQHRSQQAYDFLKREDARVFFPMHPLAHLLADGSMFHFAGALYDREELARLPLPRGQRERHFPAHPSSVCWERGEEWVRTRYFTEYTRRIEGHTLKPPWECYARGPGPTD